MQSQNPSAGEPVLVSMNDAVAMTSLSRTMLNRYRAEGRFPATVPLGDRRVAFVKSEVVDWINARIAAREARKRKSDKADTEHFDAEMPDAQAELARMIDAERLRARLGIKTCTVLDMASADSTLAEIGEYLGFGGQYATRMAGKAVKDAVVALNAARADSEPQRVAA